jgi:hypothetical protein
METAERNKNAEVNVADVTKLEQEHNNSGWVPDVSCKGMHTVTWHAMTTASS